MKVFISMPMRGKTSDEIESELREIKDNFMFDDCQFADSYLADKIEESPEDKLITALTIMTHCDAAFFDAGWEDAPGCVVEHAFAEYLGIEIYE